MNLGELTPSINDEEDAPEYRGGKDSSRHSRNFRIVKAEGHIGTGDSTTDGTPVLTIGEQGTRVSSSG